MKNIKEETRTPAIDECYYMMRGKFNWDFDGGISAKDLTTRTKVANILCALFIPQEPGAKCKTPWSYTREEFHLIELASDEIASMCGY